MTTITSETDKAIAIKRGSTTATSGYQAEADLVNLINASTDTNATERHNMLTSLLHEYQKTEHATTTSVEPITLEDIASVEAVKIEGTTKTDVAVHLITYAGESFTINVQCKKIAPNRKGFSQVDRRPVAKLFAAVEGSSIEFSELGKQAIMLYTGTTKPNERQVSSPKRLTAAELTPEELEAMRSDIERATPLLSRLYFQGADENYRPHVTVVMSGDHLGGYWYRVENTEIMRRDYVGTGEVTISNGGVMVLGSSGMLTLQRKGGDGGRPSACDTQAKVVIPKVGPEGDFTKEI